jgi:predicted GH43/DUF377 family glycosyl hydrolase
VGWLHRQETFPALGQSADLDRLRAFGPSVVEESDGTLRMWYSGHDGASGRIVEAVQPPGGPWERVGVALDAGFAGDTDAYGVESPSVVPTTDGYLMVYAGSNGPVTRLHSATSGDGRHWVPAGPCLEPGPEDGVGATHPCLLVTPTHWWLFFSGYNGSDNGRRASILAAVSSDGSSWSRVGEMLIPGTRERALSEPCVTLTHRRQFQMFYVSDDGDATAVEVATAADGVTWNRRGACRGPDGPAGDARSPFLLRLNDGGLRMWWAESPSDDVESHYRLWSADWVTDRGTPEPQPD